MIDQHGRNINKLRISLSEICNMACTYCVTSLRDHKRSPDELNSDQILYLVRLLKEHAGIEKVRLTGGLLMVNCLPEKPRLLLKQVLKT